MNGYYLIFECVDGFREEYFYWKRSDAEYHKSLLDGDELYKKIYIEEA